MSCNVRRVRSGRLFAAATDQLELAINDQFAPAASLLDTAKVDMNPAHVTYALDAARTYSQYGMNGDHAYWVSGLTLRNRSSTTSNGDPIGSFNAASHGLGAGDPAASGVQGPTPGTLSGGNMGDLQYAAFKQTWGAPPPAARSDTIDVTATNIATASIDVRRAGVDCSAKLNVTTDGPIAITLPGCSRVVRAG
jgi:hypothetical protein